ncbi:MAG: hypothetical protein NVSMB52_07400 [Chloroflexota bacterium]
MKDFALLVLRLVLGLHMAGHGAQKLFGWFKGPGLKNTGGFMESLGVAPGHIWGPMAAVGETSGGVLTILGFLNPIGPQNIMSSMAVATRRVHWKTPTWAAEGGAELALTNLGAALALAMIGPGRYSLDSALGIRIPKWLIALTWINHVAITGAALFQPQVAATIVDKATGVMGRTGSSPSITPTAATPPMDPGLEVEMRPTVGQPTNVTI